jgi:hypothetical protein
MQAPGHPGRPAARRRAGAIAALTGVAVLLHAALLSEVRWGWPAPPAPFGAMQVRAVVATLPGGAEGRPADTELVAQALRSGATARSDVTPPTAREERSRRQADVDVARAKVTALRSLPLRRRAEVVPGPASTGPREVPTPAVVHAGAAETPAPDGAAAPEPSRPSPDVESASDPIPLYRTRMPPPATLRYALRVAGATGMAELRWRPEGEAYGLRFEGRVEGGPTLTQASDGGFDSAGLAPVRHTDARTRRGMLATNFQREAGRISFSGSRAQVPLARGSQDRLSWMVQLAAVLGAEPALRQPGAVVSIPVAGLRGEAAVWRFRTVESEATGDAPAGPALVRLVRDRQGPYDVDIEVALDPARHFLPATLSLRSANGVTALELALQEAAFER